MQIRIAVDGGSCLATIYHNGKARVMIVDVVDVEEARRRQGVGTALVEKAIEVARANDVDSVELLVNPDNDAAKDLYRKAGFVRTGKVHYRRILRLFA